MLIAQIDTTGTSQTNYRQPLSIAEVGYLAIGIPLFIIGVSAWLVILGSLLSWMVAGVVGLVLIAVWLVCGLTLVVPLARRLSEVRYDEVKKPSGSQVFPQG